MDIFREVAQSYVYGRSTARCVDPNIIGMPEVSGGENSVIGLPLWWDELTSSDQEAVESVRCGDCLTALIKTGETYRFFEHSPSQIDVNGYVYREWKHLQKTDNKYRKWPFSLLLMSFVSLSGVYFHDRIGEKAWLDSSVTINDTHRAEYQLEKIIDINMGNINKPESDGLDQNKQTDTGDDTSSKRLVKITREVSTKLENDGSEKSKQADTSDAVPIISKSKTDKEKPNTHVVTELR